jgi:peroxiredoxin
MTKKLFTFGTIPFMLLLLAHVCWPQECGPVKVGDPFPPFNLKNNLSQKELAALQLPPEKTISLQQFTSEIIIIEFLNIYCHTCQLQVPVFNELWDKVHADTILRSKISILGITVGNNAQEIVKFQKSFKPQYPIIADPTKEVFDCLGNPKGTPQTYFLRKDPSGMWYILYHHRGAVSSAETYLLKIKELFKSDLEGVQPGYRVPRLFLKALEKHYPTKSFEQKRILIYFPSANTSPLENDMRNTTTQMKVLLSLIAEENLAIVITGFLEQVFPAQERELLEKTSTLYLIDDTAGALKSIFEVAENPLVCLVNDSGRIVYRADALTPARAEELLQGKVTQLKPNLTAEELLERMQHSMKEANSSIERVAFQELENGETVYLGFAEEHGNEALLIGRVVSKYSICDVCHDIHFYFIFGQNGRLVSFHPIHITKYGNVVLDENDIEKIQSRTAGKDLFKDIPFDPFVDAVTQATMSSYLIYEGLNETKTVLSDFQGNGFRKEYWKELCLAHLCQIKHALSLLRKKEPAAVLTLEDQTSINIAQLKPYIPSPKASQCPNGGKYLLIGEIPICSIHGMNLKPCSGDTETAEQ